MAFMYGNNPQMIQECTDKSQQELFAITAHKYCHKKTNLKQYNKSYTTSFASEEICQTVLGCCEHMKTTRKKKN